VRGTHAGTRSDALSKPLFIDGAARLANHAAQLGIRDYLAVDATGKTLRSPTLAARLH
jgi:thiamine biosynthesis lipoprotein